MTKEAQPIDPSLLTEPRLSADDQERIVMPLSDAMPFIARSLVAHGHPASQSDVDSLQGGFIYHFTDHLDGVAHRLTLSPHPSLLSAQKYLAWQVLHSLCNHLENDLSFDDLTKNNPCSLTDHSLTITFNSANDLLEKLFPKEPKHTLQADAQRSLDALISPAPQGNERQ